MLTTAPPTTKPSPSCEPQQVPQPSTIAPSWSNRAATHIQRLANHNVISIVLWSHNDKACEPDVLFGNATQEQLSQFAPQAIDCRRQNRTISRIHEGQVVAAVVDPQLNQTVTVHFPKVAASPVEAQHQSHAVELLAANIAIDQFAATPSTQPEPANPKPKPPRKLQLGIVVAIVAVALCPWPHRIKAKATCEPQTRRFLSAPFDAKIDEVLVKPGDSVKANQLLVRLDGTDLRSEIAGLEAKYTQATQRSTAALSTGDAAVVAIQRLEAQHLASQIDVLKSRQNRLEVRSPIDGVVVFGDLERASGATIAVGDTIFEIAPLENMVVEVAIPESQIGSVEEGQTVTVWLDALQGQSREGQLIRIHPRSEIIHHESVFVGEVELANEDRVLRPGMTGEASIAAGYESIGWLWLSRPWQSLRMTIGW